MKKPIEIPHYEEQDILSAVEAAQYMKVSKDTVYTLVAEDKIPHRYVGRQVRFPFWLLRSWLEGKAVP
jgi:excisionase family DNA binding protein